VKQLSRSKPSLITDPSIAGDVAAAVFHHLDRGTPLDEIVVTLSLPPDTVESLLRTWARLRRVVPLSEAGRRKLRELLRSAREMSNGTELVAAVRDIAARPIACCARCKQAVAEYCLSCPRAEAERDATDRSRATAARHAARSVSKSEVLSDPTAARSKGR
jgi:hypothetical protein